MIHYMSGTFKNAWRFLSSSKYSKRTRITQKVWSLRKIKNLEAVLNTILRKSLVRVTVFSFTATSIARTSKALQYIDLFGPGKT